MMSSPPSVSLRSRRYHFQASSTEHHILDRSLIPWDHELQSMEHRIRAMSSNRFPNFRPEDVHVLREVRRVDVWEMRRSRRRTMGGHRFHYVREIVGAEIDCTAIVGDELKIVRYYEGQGARERLVTDLSRFGGLRDTLFGLCLIPGHYALIFHNAPWNTLLRTGSVEYPIQSSDGRSLPTQWLVPYIPSPTSTDMDTDSHHSALSISSSLRRIVRHLRSHRILSLIRRFPKNLPSLLRRPSGHCLPTYTLPTRSGQLVTCIALTTLRHCYLLLLLRLPLAYNSRCSSLLDISLTLREEIESRESSHNPPGIDQEQIVLAIQGSASPEFSSFTESWNALVLDLHGEWQLVKFASALLVPAVLTIFQLPGATDDTFTRTTALLSLISAITSLTYSCLFIIHAQLLKSARTPLVWKLDAEKQGFWWNISIFYSMPVAWVGWSTIFFVLSILSFSWHVSSTSAGPSSSPRIFTTITITCSMSLSMLYFIIILRTFRSLR